jgi:hypothetical protein
VSFDEEPDAPLHDECADAIHTLEAEIATLKTNLRIADKASDERDAFNDELIAALRRIAECEPQADEGAFMRCAMCGCVWPDFQVGDVLVISEWRGRGTAPGYTGRVVKREITYIMEGGNFGIADDHVVLSIK